MPKLLALFALFAFVSHAQWRVGFYTVGMGQPISEVPWTKITHLALCCAEAGGNGAVSRNWLEPRSFREILSTAHAHNVRVILSIGGHGIKWTPDTSPAMVGAFVNSITSYIAGNGFDGVDLD